eukprot:gb/GECG01016534.1/.p1 GENE.gb/GECG01016534.1/~~gb/GECG01016534.1/.p1  ORF type:complete len:181 (+),score=38.64 gb/GECG01016534.1/:1-543(+)
MSSWLRDAWAKLQDTVAPPPPTGASSASSVKHRSDNTKQNKDPYAGLYENTLEQGGASGSQEGGLEQQKPHTQPPTHGEGSEGFQGSSTAMQGAQRKGEGHLGGEGAPPVAFFSPDASHLYSRRKKQQQPSSIRDRYVPVDDGFGSTAGNLSRGAKYGNYNATSSGAQGAPPPPTSGKEQ